MRIELIGKQILIDKANNLWGFLVEENDKNIILEDKHYSSSISLAIDEILEFKNIPNTINGKKVKINIEILD
ncbi:MAG: hypothetical protein K0R54_751 [Clostridiaceae bacterium]|jgi:hypothetical protein|nr:hypothetical protein [Clostridiaceae bacterium]